MKKSNGIYTLAISDDGRRLTYFGKNENILNAEVPPIFRVRFLNDDGSFALYTADDAKTVSVRETESGAEISFGGFDIPMQILLRVECPKNDPLSYWSIEVDAERQLEWAEYPCVCLKDRFKGKGNAKILSTYNEGALIENIDSRGTGWGAQEPEYPSEGSFAMYPGMLFAPFIACVDDSDGLYFGAHDGKNTRYVNFYRDGDGVRFVVRLYPSVTGGKYRSGYETVLGSVCGDWFEAADIYKQYFKKNHDEKYIKIEENKSLPEWYKKSPVVLTYCVRGHYDTDEMFDNKLFPYTAALPIIDEYAEELQSPIMVVLMHWEGTAPWAPPYVWPPHGGETALAEFVDEMHARGNSVGLYCSGLGWTQKSNLNDYSMEKAFEEQGLARYMNIAPDGSLPLSKICRDQRSGYDLCISQEFTKNTLKAEVDKMASVGIDYIQLMDQNHGGTPYMCYSREHGHPPVPGKWQSEALNEMLSEMLEKHDKLLLGCESAASEVFMPNLLFSDNRFGLNFILGQAVPAYAYIYHEYVNNFMGNNVCVTGIFDCERDKDNLAYRNAYSFLAGDLITIVLNDEGEMQWAWGQRNFEKSYQPEQSGNKAFICVLNGWRQAYPEFIHSGDMQRNPTYSCEKARLALYGRDEIVPAISCARYCASSGEIATFFVNWTKETQTLSCNETVGKAVYTQPNGKGEICENGVVSIAPRSVIMVK